MTTAQKLTRARVQLLLLQPFFGTLCLRLKLIRGDLPTMATDGSKIVYNPAFVDQLKPAELEGTLAHEVMTARWATNAGVAPAIRDSGMRQRISVSILFSTQTALRFPLAR
jgi:hypothetical protein